MPVDRFRFISPGVFINEIDQSQLPTVGRRGSGPVIFGVAEKGPALVPTTVRSYAEFVNVFGECQPGQAANGDVWRQGNYSNPTYGAYAAKAYLANGSPLTFVRLVGDQDPAASTGGQAGWEVPQLDTTSSGSTWGLFIVGSGSMGTDDPHGVGANQRGHGEGMLAAIFYLTGSGGFMELSGNLAGDSSTRFASPSFYGPSDAALPTGAAGVMMEPVDVGTKKEYKVRLYGPQEGLKETTFNFDPKSSRYIRKVFNTNPHLLNSQNTKASNMKNHLLGETFERSVVDFVTQLDDGSSITQTDFTDTYAFVMGLVSGSQNGGNYRFGYSSPATPWIIGQDDPGNEALFDINATAPTLFRVHSREGVEHAQRNYKISFSDIKASPNPQYEPYGTFSLLVRDMQDTDENPVILEQFNNLNLNPASNNFVGKRIGDKTFSYDSTNKKWREEGQYPVRSNFIRVELNEDVENGAQEAQLLPFGFRGLPTYRGFNLQSGSTSVRTFSLTTTGDNIATTGLNGTIFQDGGSGSIPTTSMLNALSRETQGENGGVDTYSSPGAIFMSSSALINSASLLQPTLPLRANSSDGNLSNQKNAFFGLTTNQAANTLVFDGTVRDIIRIKPSGIMAGTSLLSPGFSLDDLVVSDGVATHSGSEPGSYFNTFKGSSDDVQSSTPYRGSPQGARRAGSSATSVSSSYAQILDDGFNKFTVPMYGGFDGFDIFERNPINNTRALTGTNKSTKLAPMYYTLKKAIDSVGDVDQVNINMAAAPGITDTQTTDYLLAMAENRKDTLAIIDLEGGYKPTTENTESFSSRKGTSAATVQGVEDRDFNTSYGCAYYPWVQINDASKGRRVWVPPSAIALGVLAASAARTELWFAPAGFNRGGLNNGNAGLGVVNVIEKLTADQRDSLYEVNVNPIASFPAEGIVVFGQKTLQATPSALDRINVRRLMIYLKKQITQISNTILFDPNVQITWNRFLNQIEPFLDSVKQRFGLSDYRVILDSSTTTPDLIDRNILYAKILLKPTRAIEFIALDFVITRSGVEF
jgi:hypothetical protein